MHVNNLQGSSASVSGCLLYVPPQECSESIAFSRVKDSVIAADTWGHNWRGKNILFRSDNMAVCIAVEKRRVHSGRLMSLLRHLSMVKALGFFKI